MSETRKAIVAAGWLCRSTLQNVVGGRTLGQVATTEWLEKLSGPLCFVVEACPEALTLAVEPPR